MLQFETFYTQQGDTKIFILIHYESKGGYMSYLDIELKGLDKDGKEKTFKLDDFKGNRVVLYFYPKDNTQGCTIEAHDFRDKITKIGDKAVVIGVSPDDITSHKEFRKEHKLNYTLLSDVEHKLAKAFNVLQEKIEPNTKQFMVKRSTFVLDKNGKIENEWRDVEAIGHVNDVIDYIFKG